MNKNNQKRTDLADPRLQVDRRLLGRSSKNSARKESADDHCNALLRGVGMDLGLGEIEFDAQRCCLLKFDDVLVNFHAPDGPWMFMTASLFILRRPLQAECLADLLGANLYGKETAGATIAYDASTGGVLLQDRIYKQGADLQLLLDRIAAMVDCTEQWRQKMPLDQIIPLEPE